MSKLRAVRFPQVFILTWYLICFGVQLIVVIGKEVTMGGGKKGRAWKRLSNERWKEAWNEYFGPHVQKDQIKEGLRFCFYTGDFGLDRVWFEVVETAWDWRDKEELALLWREDSESFEYWSKEQICRCGHIVNEEGK